MPSRSSSMGDNGDQAVAQSQGNHGRMNAKTTKVNAEQLRRRKEFERLKRTLRPSTFPSLPAMSLGSVADAPTPPSGPKEREEPRNPDPPSATPPRPDPPKVQPQSPAPAHHGVAFAVREPMTCEICQQKVTKWLSYKPEAKTCVCWDCGVQRQERMMRGEKA